MLQTAAGADSLLLKLDQAIKGASHIYGAEGAENWWN